MEEDPTSISDVGESGDANAQHLLGAPASFQSDSLELLKKEKAELEREVFNIKAQLEDMTDKFLAVTRSNFETKQEHEGISRQFEERLRLFRDLQVANETLLVQKGAVDSECVSLKRDRDEKEIMLKRVNKEKQLIAVEVQSLKEQLKDLNGQRKELEMQRRLMEKAQNDARMESQRSIDEKAVYEESKRWFMNELTDRDTKIASLRLEHSGKEVSWQNERIRLVNEKTAAMNEVEDIKVDLALKQRLLDESNEKMKGISDSHDAQLATLKDEITSRECLIRTLKEQINRADEASNEIKSLYDNTSALLQSANEEIERAKMETAAQIEEATRIIELRDGEISELKDEIEKANDLIKNKHNLTLSDEAIEELSPAAAVASRMIKSGGSLTAIYREHAKLAAQLEEERAKSRLTEESFQEVIGQLTERAPQLIQQKELLEKYMDESYRLENQLKDADEQRIRLMEERDWASRELAFTKGELEKCQRDSDLLSEKVSRLVFVLEKERAKAKAGGRITPGADDENDEEEDRMFRDIKSLTRRNQELESELSEEKARAHQLARAEVEAATERLTRDRSEMQRELEVQRSQCMKMENALAGKQQALQSYKNIVEGGGIGGESVIAKRELEHKTAELNDANMKISRLEEWRLSEKEEKEKMVMMYEDRVKQHMAIVSEVKKTNGKMESELELQKQTAAKTYQELEKQMRKLERAMENEQKAKENVLLSEQKISGLHQKLMEMQGDISALRVERRSLDEQLKMSQSNEMRLKAELEARMQNSYHNEMMMTMMADMQAKMNAGENNKTEVMEMRVENLENERDQLKTSNAALAERNERLERERGAEVAKLSGEKAAIEAQLHTERNERIASESETNELRAKLVATQKHFTVVDDSIGTNPERLAKECQKLRNDNKFLEGQLDELKKRAEVADANAKRAEDELTKLTALSSTVESTLIDTTKAGSLEQERLKGLLEAEEMKANNLWNEVNRLRESTTALENSSHEAKVASENTILELQQKISVLEMQMRDEMAKGEGFDERMKGINDEKERVLGQLNEMNEVLMGVKGELEEMKIEKEAATERVGLLEAEMASLEERTQEESNRWMDEKMRIEGEYKRLEMESERQRVRYDEEVKRKEEQINQMMSMAREVDASSMEGDGMNQMSAVNRYLREEKQNAVERMMRAEVEFKRMKVQHDELDVERMKLDRRVKDLQAKSESDAKSLADMADLRMKLEISMKAEKELVGVKEEKEKLTKLINELQTKYTMIMNDKTKLVTDVKSLKENIGTLTSEKARENAAFRKNMQDKDNEMARLKSELAKKTSEPPAPVGGPRMMAQVNQLKAQLETAHKELADSKKELEAANARCTSLRSLAVKYKKELETASSSGGTTSEGAESSQSVTTEGMLNTPPSSVAFKRLQEEKDELNEKLKRMKTERDAIEGERDEIRFRQSSMNSMFEKAQKQKDTLAIENAELKRRLTELGVNVEPCAPVSAVVSPTKSVTSPSKTVVSISSANFTQSTHVISIQPSTPSVPPTIAVPSPQKTVTADAPSAPSAPSDEIASISAPSDPIPPPSTLSTSSTNIFGSAAIDWPDKMSRVNAPSTSGSLGGHPPLFGRSAPPSSIPSISRNIPDVTTSTPLPDIPSFSMESKGEDDQPISSSGDTRKRGATDDKMEMKRARVDEEEEEGDNDVITSSHRGNELEDVMVEDDTRDGEGEVEEEERKEETADGEEEEAVGVPLEADEEGSGMNPSMKSESNEGEKKKRSPIVWKGEEQEECSSSNESGRPSTSSVMRGRGRGISSGRSRPIRQPDLATNLMRMNRGRGGTSGGGGQRGKRGGSSTM
ncbi:npp-21 [Pristionchus pacificus]|nr:npp-21 [Pristionchus pacificus]|eukprot:PDM84855.1 npp-21 [Pristionchus pacificus]